MTTPISDGDTGSAIESALTAFTAGDTATGSDADVLSPQDSDSAFATETEVRSAVVDSLTLWLPAVNAPAPTGYLNWGSVAAGSSGDKQFRVKNLSLVSKAVGVTISLSGSGSGAANPANLHLLSADETRFTASVNVGTLPPNSVSKIITLRRVIPYGASLGAEDFNLVLGLTSWGVDFWPSYTLSLEVSSSDSGSSAEGESVV